MVCRSRTVRAIRHMPLYRLRTGPEGCVEAFAPEGEAHSGNRPRLSILRKTCWISCTASSLHCSLNEAFERKTGFRHLAWLQLSFVAFERLEGTAVVGLLFSFLGYLWSTK